jgi:hypothetical protein
LRCRVNRGGCGRFASEVGPISWRGLCIECAKRKAIAAADGMHYHEGEFFRNWRRAQAASALPPEVMALLDGAGIFGTLDDPADVP